MMGDTEDRRDDPRPNQPAEGASPHGDPLARQRPEGDWGAQRLGDRVNAIVDAVEREAGELRKEAEVEAAQIRSRAEEEARQHMEQARRHAEALVARRTQHIAELSDALTARAEEVLERLEYAVPVKSGFENLVRALGETAERLAHEGYSDSAPPSWEAAAGGGGAGEGQAGPGRYAPPSGPGAYRAPDPGTGPAPAADHGQPPASYPPGQPAQAATGSGAPGWQQLDDAHRVAIQMAAAGSTRGEVESHLASSPAPTRTSVLDDVFGPGTPADARVPWATPPSGSPAS
jgi:hypothetical protein